MRQYEFQDFDHSYLLRVLYMSAGLLTSEENLGQTLKYFCPMRLMERSGLRDLAT